MLTTYSHRCIIHFIELVIRYSTIQTTLKGFLIMSTEASIEKYWTNKLNREGRGVIAQRLEKEPFNITKDNIAFVKLRLRKSSKKKQQQEVVEISE